MKTRIILCNNSRQYFEPLEDRIEFLCLTDDVIYLQSANQALKALPETGKCIIIMESTLSYSPHSHSSKLPTSGTRLLAQKCKEKNPQCKTILYTGESYDLKKEEFDLFIDALREQSYDFLFEKLIEYCKN